MLKTLGVGGRQTKLVALGIGSAISLTELRYIASEPHDKKVILVQDFSKLPEVEEEVTDVACGGRWSLFIAKGMNTADIMLSSLRCIHVL